MKQEFKITFKNKFKDMNDVLFQRFEAGILGNKNKATFTEEQVDGSIKLHTYSLRNSEPQKFKEAYNKKVDILTNQIFYALDKDIIDNRIHITIFEGNITGHITIKTATHVEKSLFYLGDEEMGNEESDDAKHMTI